MGKVLSLDEWMAGADDGNVFDVVSVAAWPFELENEEDEEDEDDELIELELELDVENEDEEDEVPVDAWVDDTVAFVASNTPSEFAQLQQYDLPNGTIVFGLFFTSDLKIVFKSFVWAVLGSTAFKCIWRTGNASREINSFRIFASLVDGFTIIVRQKHYKWREKK